jgi:type IV pilus assembly protein PilE
VRTEAPRGFTLIELMIAVVIAATLLAIAVPGYRSYVLRAQRTEAKQVLMQLQAAQEKFYIQNNRYAGAAELTTAPPAGLGLLPSSQSGRYAFALGPNAAAPGGAGYVATATPTAVDRQNEDRRCASFSVDQSGGRLASDSASADSTAECWR